MPRPRPASGRLRPRRRRRIRLSPTGWVLVAAGTASIVLGVWGSISRGRLLWEAVVLGAFIILLAPLPSYLGKGGASKTPGWRRTAPLSTTTAFMDAEDAEWEAMRKNRIERRHRREAKERTRRHDEGD